MKRRTAYVGCVLSLSVCSWAGTRYVVEDRTFGPAHFLVSIGGINESGVVAGTYEYFPGRQAFRSDASGVTTLFSGFDTWAKGINDAGEIVGSDYYHKGLVWKTSGAMVLDAPAGAADSPWQAKGINNSGVSVGSAQVNSRSRVVTWDSAGHVVEVPLSAPGYDSFFATSITDAGIIAGGTQYETLLGTSLPWTRSASGELTMYSLPANVGLFSGGWIADVNSSEQGIGYYGTSVFGGTSSAFVVDKSRFGTQAMSIGTLGGSVSRAYSINDSGMAVGWSVKNDAGPTSAFVWNFDDGMVDMNTLLSPASAGWDLRDAQAINSAGWIAGWGYNPSGQYTLFVAKPVESVPEPASILVMAAGSAWLARKRRNR